MSIEVMKQALEALENAISDDKPYILKSKEAITALRQAIEFAEMVKKGTKAWADTPDDWVDELRGGAEKQEPVAWHEPGAYGNVTTHKDWALANGWEPLYTAPREWVGLTDEELEQVRSSCGYNQFMTAGEYADAVQKATEAKLKEKNGA